MKRIFSALLAFLVTAADLLIFGILPMPSLTKNGIPADDPIYLTAHRGAKAQAPDNTIPAYKIAIEKGFYAVETDVHLTKDGVWVISHNDNLKKWYGADVDIKDANYEDLLKYRVIGGKGFLKYGTLRIPTLEEYLDLFVGTASRPQIEIKTGSDYTGIDQILDMVHERGLDEQAMIISFDLGQLQYIRSLDDDIELWYLCGEITDEVIAEAKSIGNGENVWLSCSYDENTVASMQRAVDAGVPVSMWTVDSVKEAKKLYEAGFRYMETDRLAP